MCNMLAMWMFLNIHTKIPKLSIWIDRLDVKMFMCMSFFWQDTTVCGSKGDPVHSQIIHISTKGQGEDVTYPLTMHTSDDTQRWTEALWQHIYNISETWVNKILTMRAYTVLSLPHAKVQVQYFVQQGRFLFDKL